MRSRDLELLTLWVMVTGTIWFGGCGGSSPPVISVSVTSAALLVDASGNTALTALVKGGTSNLGVTWTLSGSDCAGNSCGTLSGATATTVTYTAPKTLSVNLTVTVTGTAVADGTKSGSQTLTIAPLTMPTTTSLPDATGGAQYNATLQATGGFPPYSWSLISGAVPQGMTLNGDGTITGTPTQGGTVNFTVQVADSTAQPVPGTEPLSITVAVLPLTITTTAIPDGAVDTIYDQQVQATGGIGPYTWSLASGSLPAWATLDPSSGRISGIPGTTASADFVIQAADGENPALSKTQALTINVDAKAGANNGELNGHYAFLFEGYDDASAAKVAILGSFTADGNGHITSGIADQNGATGMATVAFTGTYNIDSDNRGGFTWVTATGSATFAVALGQVSSGLAQGGRFVQFDDIAGSDGRRGSGLLQRQDPTAFSLGKIAGPYAFLVAGQDAAGHREATAGAFTADGAGSIPSGVEDENINGTATNPNVNGTYTTPSGTEGRVTMTLTPSSGTTLTLAVYVVSSGEFLGMTTDSFATNGLQSGMVLSQSSGTFDAKALDATSVYYQLGLDSAAAVAQSAAEVGLITGDGNGGLGVVRDRVTATGISQGASFSATYTVGAAGRVSINGWPADTTNLARVLYLVDKNQGFFLDVGPGVGTGFVEAQTGIPSGGFALTSFSGTFLAGTIGAAVNGSAHASGTINADGAGNFSEVASLSGTGGLVVNETTTGTYELDSSGRGNVTSLQVAAANVGSSILALVMMAWLIFATRKSQKQNPKSMMALFCFAIWLLQTPHACRKVNINKLVFYLVSPTKAVLMPEQSNSTTTQITIVEP